MNAEAAQTATPLAGPPVLAAGAWFESTPCRVVDGRLYRADSAGDLIDADACRRFDTAVETLLALDASAPAAIAHDLHPDFHSTRVALTLAARAGVPAFAIQHHHAHIAAVLAEHNHPGPVIGLAIDGVGLGDDGGAWGGELLHVDRHRFSRLGHLRPLPLPGGDRAAREPWRMAAAVLHVVGRGGEIATRFGHHGAAAQLDRIIDHARLSPLTSSLGRHFDAAAALLGLCELNRSGPEGAIALESAARSFGAVDAHPGDWRIEADGTLDLVPLLSALADETDPARGAARFHHSLAAGCAQWLQQAARAHDCTTIALGGGCLHNRILTQALQQRLEQAGLAVLRPLQLPPGDAGLSVGQAWIAQRILEQGN